MTNAPSANGNHATDGKFSTGNPGGPGNPHAGQVAKLRAVLLEAVTEDDMRAVVLKLVELAKSGDLKAIDLLLTRTLGKADSGPSVAVQVNQQANGQEETPGRVSAILARLRAERGKTPMTPDNLETRKAELRERIMVIRTGNG